MTIDPTKSYTATIDTSRGRIVAELFAKDAPKTVNNFVFLAREKFYDGTTFHRVIADFMIQGGDPTGTGGGEPGYVIPDEIWEGSKHDQRGLICMANRGRDTNGMQFFIMDAPKTHLDGGYTIFGKCTPDAVIEKLASSETMGDKAVNPPVMERVSIKRVAGK